MPLFHNTPITEFTLDIYFTPYNANYRSELIAEQFYLLIPKFNLNTIRVANNPSGSNAKSIFMYNRDYSIMYYRSTQQMDFIRELSIAHTTFTKHLMNGTYYLNKYVFSREFVGDAVIHTISVTELVKMLAQDRIVFNKTKPVSPNSVAIRLVHEKSGEVHHFPSLGSCVDFLKTLGTADIRTLLKRADTGVSYQGFLCYRVTKKDV